MKPTPTELKAALTLAFALHQAIHESGPAGIPSGHLYAAVMGKCDLAAYEGAISFLEKQNVIERNGQLLVSTVPRRTE